ncbi:hypothetical protein [Parvularcula marina]|uniref:Glutamine amidotransferase domain-containing protein n=1 Tax=Parvularcula marina TaxID=2292771 RepID=A0A371REU5_9PROT|nr:hypothetical protein [Parvularcula marina]RFB03968.1 hypothetical protein DX908_00905 [Parvularcula marina]
MTGLSLSPLLPIPFILILTVLGLAAAAFRIRISRAGFIFRTLAVLAGAAFLLSPQWRHTEGEDVQDIAVILEDQSRSLEFGGRDEIAQSAADRLAETLTDQGLDVRRIGFGSRTETNLANALTEGLADIPRRRLSAITVISDGQVQGDLEIAASRLDVPVHSLVTGNPGAERDRRVEIVSAPRFGVVGETVELVFRIVSPGETGTLTATLSVDGEPYTTADLAIDEDVTLTVPLHRPGDRLIELALEPLPGELTPLNNRAVTALTAVRDRLRVLLVSGEPHAGERVWRNILKSDPAVDLVHFTILKPAEKVPVAREEDLNLIQFPHVELFLEKLPDFDVLIFDRYTYRGVLQAFEFEQIARYVERGGAVLIAAGPEFAERGSLANRPNLDYILPATPSGAAQENAFLPTQSETGLRHPVTRTLGSSRDWGRWLRLLPAQVRRGDVLMTGTNDQPLLVVDRVGDGRIAMLLSDHIWLWARDFDGGGPHRELLRRLVHWLMQEPELEEEALTGHITPEGVLEITRQSLGDEVPAVTIITPEGDEETVTLNASSPGEFTATADASLPGLYRLETLDPDGDVLFALASSGEEHIAEIDAVTTTTDILAPFSEATGGSITTLTSASGTLPNIRRVAPGRETSGTRWMGFPRRNTMQIEAVRIRPILTPWIGFGLMGGLLLLAWLLEGQPWRRNH